MTTDKFAGMAAIVKNLPYFGFENLATLLSTTGAMDAYSLKTKLSILTGSVTFSVGTYSEHLQNTL